MSVNLNEVARELTKAEGLKNEIQIGDVKELLNKLFTSMKAHEVVQIWMKYNKIKA